MNLKFTLLFAFFLCLESVNVKCNTVEGKETLQLVQILFRHGERTADPGTLYPNDPHFNASYYPYGRNELTKKGKQTMYTLGKELRKRYDTFLGPIYTPDIIDGFSAHYNKTKASLEIVFAGLFPPTAEEIFENGLNWQPIPYYYVPEEEDDMYLPTHCPNFYKQLETFTMTSEFKEKVKPDLEFLNYISKNAGMEYANYYEALFLLSCLKVEEHNGLVLPAWTKQIYPELLENIGHKGYELAVATPDIAQISAGSFLQKLITNAKSRVDENSVKKNRKIVLYSGHDATIAIFLNVLKIYKLQHPSFGACVMIELHKINQTYGFKIYYRNDISNNTDLLKLPNCEEFCPLEEFILLTKPFMPAPGVCGHKNIRSSSSKVFSIHQQKLIYL